jgi:hypothetical protein
MTLRRSLAIASLATLAAMPVLAQVRQAPPEPNTNSGVLRRVPLDEWMPESCPNPEQRGEIVVCGRPDEEPTVPEAPPQPGDAGTDVQSERAALVAPESAAPGAQCTTVGAGGSFGCANAGREQWRRERKLQKAREAANQPQ